MVRFGCPQSLVGLSPWRSFWKWFFFNSKYKALNSVSAERLCIVAEDVSLERLNKNFSAIKSSEIESDWTSNSHISLRFCPNRRLFDMYWIFFFFFKRDFWVSLGLWAAVGELGCIFGLKWWIITRDEVQSCLGIFFILFASNIEEESSHLL